MSTEAQSPQAVSLWRSLHLDDVISAEWAVRPECLPVVPPLKVQGGVSYHVGARRLQTGLLLPPLKRHGFNNWQRDRAGGSVIKAHAGLNSCFKNANVWNVTRNPTRLGVKCVVYFHREETSSYLILEIKTRDLCDSPRQLTTQRRRVFGKRYNQRHYGKPGNKDTTTKSVTAVGSSYCTALLISQRYSIQFYLYSA